MTSTSPSSHSDSASPPDASLAAAFIPAEEKPYHSKRPHKKSRSGCKNCKARKVKCDEAQPACRACRLRKTECVYPGTTKSTSPPTATTKTISSAESLPPTTATVDFVFSEPPSQSLPSTSVSSLTPSTTAHDDSRRDSSQSTSPETDLLVISEPMFRPAPAVDEVDMRLLWFYTTATCSSFSVECGIDRPVENVMRTKLVQHAFETPFLMHSILALSALHLQNMHQDVDTSRALMYRAKSFQGYRKAVEEGNPKTFPGLIANSLFLTALSSQNFRDPDAKDLYILDWMIVWRGIGLMVHMMGIKAIYESGLASIFYRPPMDLETSPTAIPNNLLFLVSSIHPDDIDFPEMETYYNTLKYLGILYQHLRKHGVDPIMKLRIITWFTFLPRRFVELAQEKRHRALIIIAYYGMFLKLGIEIWWMKEIGQRTLGDITRHLGLDWAEFMRLPLLAMSINDIEDLCRHILEEPEWVSPHAPSTDYAFEQETLDRISDLCWVDNTGIKVEVAERDNQMVLVDRTTNITQPVWSLP